MRTSWTGGRLFEPHGRRRSAKGQMSDSDAATWLPPTSRSDASTSSAKQPRKPKTSWDGRRRTQRDQEYPQWHLETDTNTTNDAGYVRFRVPLENSWDCLSSAERIPMRGLRCRFDPPTLSIVRLSMKQNRHFADRAVGYCLLIIRLRWQAWGNKDPDEEVFSTDCGRIDCSRSKRVRCRDGGRKQRI